MAIIVGSKLLHGVRSLWFRAEMRTRGVSIGHRTKFVVDDAAHLTLGMNVSIGYGSIVIVTDEMSAAVKSGLTIGDGTTINEYCNVRASGGNIAIGRDCLISQFVSIIGSNHSTELQAPIRSQQWATANNWVTIGDDVWIGAGASILPGVSIGNGAVVAAGAIVTRNIPAFEIWGGVPASKISQRGPTEHRTDTAGRHR